MDGIEIGLSSLACIEIGLTDLAGIEIGLSDFFDDIDTEETCLRNMRCHPLFLVRRIDFLILNVITITLTTKKWKRINLITRHFPFEVKPLFSGGIKPSK